MGTLPRDNVREDSNCSKILALCAVCLSVSHYTAAQEAVPTSPFCKPCSLRSLVSTTISSSLIIGISLSVRLDMRLQSKAASWHVLSRLPDRHARRRRPPQQLDILGRQPIRLVDQIGQAALQPKRLGLALPHRCSLLGVAVAQRPQAAGVSFPAACGRRLRTSSANAASSSAAKASSLCPGASTPNAGQARAGAVSPACVSHLAKRMDPFQCSICRKGLRPVLYYEQLFQ